MILPRGLGYGAYSRGILRTDWHGRVPRTARMAPVPAGHAAAAVDRRDYDWSIPDQGGRVKSVAEGTIEGTGKRQPRPGVKGRVPHPARIADGTSPVAECGKTVGPGNGLSRLVASGRFVGRPHVAPGVEFVRLLRVELLNLQFGAED